MFITVEGTEGAGKSTLLAGLSQYLQQQGKTVCLTREPGGTPLAEQIRSLLLGTDGEKPVADCELLLLFAARAQHLQTVIQPALNRQHWVLCDRYTDATYAYQCGGRGLPHQQISALQRMYAPLLPDLTFWLDLPVAVGMQRAGRRGALDRFEQEHLSFFERVRTEYGRLALSEPKRIHKLDATLGPEQVLQQAIGNLI